MILADFVNVKTGFPLRKAAKEDPQGDATLVQMKDLRPFEGVNWGTVIPISTEGRRNVDFLKDGDILFVGRGSRFFASLIKSPREDSVASPHFYVLRNKKQNKISSEFLVWYLNSQSAQKFYTTNQEGSALPYISRKTLDSMPVQVPDIERQKEIVNAHKYWQKQKSLLKELIHEKDAYINAILEKAVQGEVK